MNVMDIIMEKKLVPVVVLNDIADTEPTLNALCEGGLPIAEITFRTACAADAIKLGVEKFPNMLIGAGTVINAEQAEIVQLIYLLYLEGRTLGDITRVLMGAGIKTPGGKDKWSVTVIESMLRNEKYYGAALLPQ